MGITELAAIVAAIALVALTGYVIPVLLELKRTMVELRQASARTEAEMKLAAQDLHDTFAELKHFSKEATERLEEVKPLTEAISETGRHVRSINSVLGAVTTVVAGSSMWMTGAKAAGRFIFDRYSKKGGK